MFDLQILRAGTVLSSYLGLPHNNPLHNNDMLEQCLANTLKEFSNDPYVGGKRSNGFGRVSFEYSPKLSDDTKYVAFVKKHQSRIKDILTDEHLFADYKCILKYRE